MEKVSQTKGGRRQIGTAILLSVKIDLRLKLIRREKEGTFTAIKGTTNQHDINFPKHACTTESTLPELKKQININPIILLSIF